MTTPDHPQDRGEGEAEPSTAETPQARRGRYVGVGIALGTGLGIAFGALFGLLVLDNIGFGLPFGMCLGVAIGAAIGSQRAAAADRAEAGEGPTGPEAGPTG